MPMYETMLVTSATLDEETAASVVGKFKSLIEANGTIDAVEEWGKRRLAYPINKEEDGVYTLIHFTANDAEFPAELDRVYKITDGVLRSLIIAKDEVMEAARVDAAEKAKAAKAAAEKARAEKAEADKAAAEKAEAEKAEAAKAEAEKAEAPAEEPAAEEAKTEEPEQEAAEEPAQEGEA